MGGREGERLRDSARDGEFERQVEQLLKIQIENKNVSQGKREAE